MLKKCLALLLALTLTLGVCILPVSAEAKPGEADPDKPPVILIDGINASELVRDMGTKDEKIVFPFSGDDIVSLLKDNAAAVWDMLDGDFTQENENALLNAVYGLMDGFAMNNDGTSKYNVRVNWVFPGQERPRYEEEEKEPSAGDKLKAWFSSLFGGAPEELTEEELLNKMLHDRSTYKFRYDWRLDMFEIAKELRSYINYMKKLTGHDTVTLVGFSEGAAVLNTYLSVYGCTGLNSVIWYAGAHNGVELVGQLFTGRIRVDAAALTEYVRDNGDSSIAAELLSGFMRGLKAIGVTGNLLEITNKIISTLLEHGAFRSILRNTMGKMPAIWSLIGDQYYEEAKSYVFSEKGDARTFAKLIKTIDRYHYEVQAKSKTLMAKAKKATGKIGVIAKYGLRVTPLIVNDRVQTDGLIDVAASSCGAVAAPYGETLGKNYVQKKADGHNHLSADGVIDASAALYPENTWFVKNLMHSTISEYVYGLFDAIADADHQFTVFESPEFPQFSVYEPIEGKCSPLTENSATNVLQRLLLRIRVYFRSLIARFKNAF